MAGKVALISGIGALLVGLLVLGCGASLASGAPERTEPGISPASESREGREEVPIKLLRAYSGAFIAEDFSSPELDKTTWGIWPNDPGVEVKVENGEARITGTTGPDMPVQYNHVVLASKVLWPADQVLVAGIRAASGIDEQKGSQIFEVHLCGCTPDYHSSVAFARIGGRTGWLRIYRVWERDFTDTQWLPPFGDEAEAFHLVKLEYKQGRVRGFVEGPEGFVELGQAVPNFHGQARAELKVIMAPRNFFVDMRMDNCRMYLHPEVYPALFAVNNDFRYHAKNFVGAKNEGLTLKVFEKKSGKLVGQSDFDPDLGSFSVMLDRDVTFPIGADVKVYRGGELFSSASIESRGLSGLYPGDVYEIIEKGSERRSVPSPRRNR